MMIRHFTLQLALGLCVLSFSLSLAYAADVKGLYEATRVVPNQSRNERNKAMSEGLAQVLAKVSGRPDVAKLPNVAELLQNPDAYVQQYQYRAISEQRMQELQLEQGMQYAWFRFDEGAINKVLRDNGLTVWGRTRPTTLVWLAVDQEGSHYLLSRRDQDSIRAILEEEALQHGLPVLLPNMDLDDQALVKFGDIWANVQQPIFRASSRYQTNAILVGRMSLSENDQWTARWILYEGGRGLSWQTQANTVNPILNSGVLGTLEILANVYNTPAGDDTPGTLQLAVENVNNLDQFARVTKYLKSLEPIKRVQASQIDRDSVIFKLNIRGSASGLAKTIALGRVLSKVQNTMGESGQSTTGMDMRQNSANEIVQFSNSASLVKTEHVYRLIP